jgi:hypothetical protein
MKEKILAAALCSVAGIHGASAGTVFFSDFNGSLPSAIAAGSASLADVEGFAGLGSAANQFGGTFLRSATGNTVTLTLDDLPAHTSLNLGFLFAAIDSLDGTGVYPSGDFLHVAVDGVTVFRESFANALESQIQSYVPATGVELARRVDLGFGGPGGYYTDSAYDLGADPVFSNIAHTASSVTITFLIEGVGIQALSDESWAMDNLRVEVNEVPVPAAAWLFGSALVGLAGFARRHGAG